MSDKVKIVEVGPRDGLQNEKQPVSLEDKVRLVNLLSETGVAEIETGSFVSPKWVPQMANSDQVFQNISRHKNVVYSALTPNLRGMEAAIEAGAEQVAIFAAASESFSQKNINCSISESIQRFEPLIALAKSNNIPVRAYISCVLGCPYEGEVSHQVVIETARQMMDMGCFELSLGDTIGVGTAFDVDKLLRDVLKEFSPDVLAMHFHDTYGQAVANTLMSLEHGIRIFDASVAGLGGCPYAKGASGNVSTEDMVYLLSKSGMESGVDLDKLVAAGEFICQAIGRQNQSHVANALRASCA